MVLSLLVGCAASGETTTTPPPDTAATTGTEAPASDASSTQVAEPPPVLVGNDAVRARLASLPAAPVPLETRVLALDAAQASAMCEYIDTLHAGHPVVQARCADGSPVLVDSRCNAANLASAAELLGASCALAVGEYVACELAVRDDPCTVDFMHARAPECEAVNACLATAQTSE